MQQNSIVNLVASFNDSDYYIIDNEIDDVTLLSFIDIDKNDYMIYKKKPWIYCNHVEAGIEDRISGWKIHISAKVDNHIEILKIVSAYCKEHKIDFKFIANTKLFKSVNNKGIDRLSSGKFIVLYPKQGIFNKTLEEVAKLTKKYVGPNILSDYRFSDSSVVYYRFGEINPIRKRDEFGVIRTYIKDDSGSLVVDKKFPYPLTPHWVEPLNIQPVPEMKSRLLDMYTPKAAIKFSSIGGIYVVEEKMTGETFVLKEARAHTGFDNTELEATDRLKREFKFLENLKESGLVPKVKMLYVESGNCYLVEEKLSGSNLREFIYLNNPLITNEKSATKITHYYKQCYKIFHDILLGINIINGKNIYISDLSDSNIMICEDNGNVSVKFIDFEHAIKMEELDYRSDVQTPGFKFDGEIQQSDVYKVYIMGLAMLFPIQNSFEFNRGNILKTIDLLSQLTYDSYGKKMLYEVRNFFSSVLEIESIQRDKTHCLTNMLQAVLDSYKILSTKDIDLFFPADSQIFNTNRYSLAHGGMGILYSLDRLVIHLNDTQKNKYNFIKKEILSFYLEDIKNDKVDLPISLLMGELGISSYLIENKQIDRSTIPINKILEKIKSLTNPSIFYGSSGLILFVVLHYKNKLLSGEFKQYIQENFVDKIPSCDKLGIYEGDAGIALIYLILFLSTGNQKFLEKGCEITHMIMDKVYLNSHGNWTINRLSKDSEKVVESPFLYDGLSGIGYLNLFYYKITKESFYLKNIKQICCSLDYKISYYASLMRGLSGITDFLISCIQEKCFEETFSDNLLKIVEHQINTILTYEQFDEAGNGKGFLGEQNLKISHDYYTGTTGIALVLDRYMDLKRGIYTQPAEYVMAKIFELMEEWGRMNGNSRYC